jgi:ribonuclease HI
VTDHRLVFELFTDGACSGNPGPGGWGYLLRNLASGEESRVSGGEPLTTNNRMELLSAIRGLAATPPSSQVQLVTDSAYVAKGITEWMKGWKARGWMRKEGRKFVPVKNVELWQELDTLLTGRSVTVEQIRGHAGHEENEECDRLAVQAYQKYLR